MDAITVLELVVSWIWLICFVVSTVFMIFSGWDGDLASFDLMGRAWFFLAGLWIVFHWLLGWGRFLA